MQTTATVWVHRQLVGPIGVYGEGWSTAARAAAGGSRTGVHGGVSWLVTRDLRLDAHWGRTVHGGRGTPAGVGFMARH